MIPYPVLVVENGGVLQLPFSPPQLLTRGGKGDGHIPRNIRLTLAALELLHPWVDMLAVDRDAKMQDYLRVTWKVCVYLMCVRGHGHDMSRLRGKSLLVLAGGRHKAMSIAAGLSGAAIYFCSLCANLALAQSTPPAPVRFLA
jgi:hypothetical protein